MLLVLLLAGGIWGLGVVMKTPKNARWTMIALLYVTVLVGHVVLPDGNGLRMATGETAAPWLMLGGIAALVHIYRLGLVRLRGKVLAKDAPVVATGTFGSTEIERYTRHIMLREIGGSGQKALKNARVLVIGAGGLGSPVLMYLAAAGVGTIGVIDDDVVEATNLQRQIIHQDAGLGMPKVHSAERAMQALNPYVHVRPYNRRLTKDIIEALFADYDLILDGTDNFDTRYLVNRVAAKLGKPLIAGALTQWEGQISTYDPARGGPCYQCIFPKAPAAGLAPSCAEAGVAGPLPGVVGAMMAVEAVKEITGAGVGLTGQMLIYDALYGESRKIALKPRADCPVCGKG
ncbi:HesA/MoeB/ThiF family protein [Pseudogemmobacter sp. W21_MBD1_M6]|uniref:HesA/MoeB/ThiF family protein n=1 Tax=Pseudogemmobacter sp. W21_MBD1_M6 TaxID=3240271 RepID=UPI003F946051